MKGLPHKVDRSNVYQDVLDLYRERSIVGEHPIFIKYVGELGVVEGVFKETCFLHSGNKLIALCSNDQPH